MNTEADRIAARHTPVLLERCLDLLAPALDGPHPVVVDATLGMGGHSEGILQRFPSAHVIGIDRDPQALRMARQRLAPFENRLVTAHTTYNHLLDVLAEQGLEHVDAVLMDLGVSSYQLDHIERGFSYAHDALLDMRMDPTSGQSAADFLQRASLAEIIGVLRTYGEERFAPAIARAIVQRNQEGHPLTRTSQLAELVKEVIPAPARRKGGNPSKRTFQALRVAVNDELKILADALPQALEAVRVGGRVVVESYQSLEDRLVKRAFAAGLTDAAPPEIPIVPEEQRAFLKALTHGAEQADAMEQSFNARSASVRLRAVEKIRNTRKQL